MKHYHEYHENHYSNRVVRRYYSAVSIRHSMFTTPATLQVSTSSAFYANFRFLRLKFTFIPAIF